VALAFGFQSVARAWYSARITSGVFPRSLYTAGGMLATLMAVAVQLRDLAEQKRSRVISKTSPGPCSAANKCFPRYPGSYLGNT
jgi:hypothetical protein